MNLSGQNSKNPELNNTKFGMGYYVSDIKHMPTFKMMSQWGVWHMGENVTLTLVLMFTFLWH